MTAFIARTGEELGKCLALRAKSGSFLQDFAFHTKSLSVFQKASVWARQKCEIAKARLENPTPASGKSNSRFERIPPRYCCRLTLSNPRLNNCERRPPQNCRQCENTPSLRRTRRMRRTWMRMRMRMMRVFNVERSVVKVVAHTPAGICPLPVFAPGLRINVEVGDQS